MSSVTASASARDTIPSLSVSNFFSTVRNSLSGTSCSRFRLSGTGSVTVTVHETETSLLSAETAVTTAVPAESAVTVTDVPVAALSVTAPLSTLQFTAGFEASSGTTATLNVCVSPTVRETGCSTAGVGVSPVTGFSSGTGSVTVTVQTAVRLLFSATTAFTSAFPAAIAVTFPSFTVTIFSFELSQRTF